MPSTILADSYGAESDGWLMALKAVSEDAVAPLPAGSRTKRPPPCLARA